MPCRYSFLAVGPLFLLAAAALALGLVVAPVLAQSDAPITVGFAMSVTGPLAPNGKQALAGAKIWEE